MSTAPKRPATQVRPLAERIVAELRPHCHRIEVAGSLRRRSRLVSDIEIVCEPIIVERDAVVGRTLFGDTIEHVRENKLDQAVNRLLVRSELWEPRLDKNGRQAIGERYKRLLVDGVALDLFSVFTPASWGVVFAIRTGPAEFSRRLVTQRSKGGWLPNDCRVAGGTVVSDGGMVDGFELIEERDFFTLCGLDWIEPEDRK